MCIWWICNKTPSPLPTHTHWHDNFVNCGVNVDKADKPLIQTSLYHYRVLSTIYTVGMHRHDGRWSMQESTTTVSRTFYMISHLLTNHVVQGTCWMTPTVIRVQATEFLLALTDCRWASPTVMHVHSSLYMKILAWPLQWTGSVRPLHCAKGWVPPDCASYILARNGLQA